MLGLPCKDLQVGVPHIRHSDLVQLYLEPRLSRKTSYFLKVEYHNSCQFPSCLSLFFPFCFNWLRDMLIKKWLGCCVLKFLQFKSAEFKMLVIFTIFFYSNKLNKYRLMPYLFIISNQSFFFHCCALFSLSTKEYGSKKCNFSSLCSYRLSTSCQWRIQQPNIISSLSCCFSGFSE